VSLLSCAWIMQPQLIFIWLPKGATPAGKNWERLRRNLTSAHLWESTIVLSHRHDLLSEYLTESSQQRAKMMLTVKLEAVLTFGGAALTTDSLIPIPDWLQDHRRHGLSDGVFLAARGSTLASVWHSVLQRQSPTVGHHGNSRNDTHRNPKAWRSGMLPSVLCHCMPTLCHIESMSLSRPSWTQREIGWLYDAGRLWNWRRYNFVVRLWLGEGEGEPADWLGTAESISPFAVLAVCTRQWLAPGSTGFCRGGHEDELAAAVRKRAGIRSSVTKAVGKVQVLLDRGLQREVEVAEAAAYLEVFNSKLSILRQLDDAIDESLADEQLESERDDCERYGLQCLTCIKRLEAALSQRFGKPEVVVKELMHKISELRLSDASLRSLQQFHDDISAAMRSLNAQGVSANSYESLLVPSLMSKCPSAFRLELLRAAQMQGSDINSLESLLRSLKQEITVRESAGQGQFLSSKESTKSSSPAGSSSSKASPRHSSVSTLVTLQPKASKQASSKIFCTYCKGSHSSESCTNLVSADQRRAFLASEKRCFRCLRLGHLAPQCKDPRPCRGCSGRHHVSICIKNSQAGRESDKPSTSAKKPASPPNQCLASVTESFAFTMFISDNPAVALPVAKAILLSTDGRREMMVRVLFDTASNRSYIRQDICDLLGIQANSLERLNVSSFAGNSTALQSGSANIALRKMDSFELRDGRYSVQLPWSLPKESIMLTDHFDLSFRRLISTRRQLERDQTKLAQCEAIIAEQEALGIIERVPILNIHDYSSWPKLTRVVAWVRRFISNARAAAKKSTQQQQRSLTTAEVVDAETSILRAAQQIFLGPELKHLQGAGPRTPLVQQLQLFLGDDGLIRSKGRLADAVPFDTNHPVLIPGKTHIELLIIRHCHLAVFHGGVPATLCKIRERFWVLKARQRSSKRHSQGRSPTVGEVVLISGEPRQPRFHWKLGVVEEVKAGRDGVVRSAVSIVGQCHKGAFQGTNVRSYCWQCPGRRHQPAGSRNVECGPAPPVRCLQRQQRASVRRIDLLFERILDASLDTASRWLGAQPAVRGDPVDILDESEWGAFWFFISFPHWTDCDGWQILDESEWKLDRIDEKPGNRLQMQDCYGSPLLVQIPVSLFAMGEWPDCVNLGSLWDGLRRTAADGSLVFGFKFGFRTSRSSLVTRTPCQAEPYASCCSSTRRRTADDPNVCRLMSSENSSRARTNVNVSPEQVESNRQPQGADQSAFAAFASCFRCGQSHSSAGSCSSGSNSSPSAAAADGSTDRHRTRAESRREIRRLRTRLFEFINSKQQPRNYSLMIRYLLHWQVSVYSLVWTDVLLWIGLYTVVNVLYRHALDPNQQATFVRIVHSVGVWQSNVPVTFLLGFYVSTVVDRWWKAYLDIPTMSTPALRIESAVFNNQDPNKAERIRLTLSRYMNLAWLLYMWKISEKIKQRFRILKSLIGEKNRYPDKRTVDWGSIPSARRTDQRNERDQHHHTKLLAASAGHLENSGNAEDAFHSRVGSNGRAYPALHRIQSESVRPEVKANQVELLVQDLVLLNQDPVVQENYGEIITPSEIAVFEARAWQSPGHYSIEYELPLHWASAVAWQAAREGFVHGHEGYETIVRVLCDWMSLLGAISKYANKNLPLVYTQVVIIAVYTWFFIEVVASQNLMQPHVANLTSSLVFANSSSDIASASGVEVPETDHGLPHSRLYSMQYWTDFYVPIFALVKLLFVLGWFKVAFLLMDPYGDDLDGLPFSDVLNSNLRRGRTMAGFPSRMLPKKLQQPRQKRKEHQHQDQTSASPSTTSSVLLCYACATNQGKTNKDNGDVDDKDYDDYLSSDEEQTRELRSRQAGPWREGPEGSGSGHQYMHYAAVDNCGRCCQGERPPPEADLP
uniref:CCHC-type domain-containing protein n=1 Tax=Macrostomum lignano TaxID=282301 RepID=A0A1I8H6U5_9PLAT